MAKVWLLEIRKEPNSWSSKSRLEQKQNSGCLDIDSLSYSFKDPETFCDQIQK